MHRQSERALPQTITGPALIRKQLASVRGGISLASGDFDGDGTPDLITGYAVSGGGALTLQRGNAGATAPSPAEFAAMRSGQLIAPFTANAAATLLPVRPDFVRAVDFDGNGTLDVVVAAKGGNSAYVLLGDGKGGFSTPQALAVQGSMSALTTWRGPGGETLLVAGACGSSGCGLQILAADGTHRGAVELPAAANSIEAASFNGGVLPDFAVLAGGKALVIDGDSVAASFQGRATPVIDTLPGAGAVAIASGSFIYDRRGFLQMAVLGSDATLRVLARSGVDSSQVTRQEAIAARQMSQSGVRPSAVPKRTGMAWSEMETLPNIGPGGSSALLLRGRFSGSGVDDLAVLNQGQYVQISHPSRAVDGVRQTTAQVTVDSTGSVVTAALPARVTPDARVGVLAASGGAQPLTVTPPSTSYNTYNVNSTLDATPNATSEGACVTKASGCTLRAAIYLANLDYSHNTTGTSSIDTINIIAGTFVLSANNGSATDVQGSANIHLDLDASMNLVGAGSGSTIIKANSVDKVFSVDSGVVRGNALNNYYAIDPINVFLSGMTLENGTNPNVPSSTTCAFACNFYGGNMDWEADGTGNLTMNNLVVTQGAVSYAGGGGIFASNSAGSGTGTLELDNSTVSMNGSPESGGGLFLGYDVPMVLTSDTFSNNNALASLNSGSDPNSTGIGGAIATNGNSTGQQDAITGCTFNQNGAALRGGAMDLGNGFTMASTTSTSNSTLANGYGGAMHFGSLDTTGTITNSTFTGNTVQTSGSGDGGAICVSLESATGSQAENVLNIHYSRIHGNTGPSGSNTGLGIGCQTTPITNAASYATLNAADNWWGCNTAPTTTGTACDFVGQTTTGTDEIVSDTVSPFTQLKISLNTATPAGGSTLTATGTLNSDSSGSTYSTGQDAAYAGLPATLAIVQQDGTTTNSSATALSSTGTITTSTTATVAGTGTATVTVDGFSVAAPFTVSAPNLTVTSTHTGNFKAGDTADTYTVTVTNSGNAPSSGTVTAVDTLPSGFTATALSGSGWSCTLASLTCTRSDALAGSSSYPAITLTVGVSSTDAGTFSNSVAVSGGGNVSTNTGMDSTIVVGQPTISEGFNPTTVAPNANSTVTFTLGNPSANTVSLTGVAFSDTLPTGLRVSTPSGAATTCTSGMVTATAGGGSVALSGATIGSGATCTVTVNVNSPSIGSYTNTTGTETATNSNPGGTASATLMVTVTPTKLVYTSASPTPLTAGGNAGTVSVALEDPSGNVATNNSTTMVTLLVTGPSGYSQMYPAVTATNGVAMFNLSSVQLTLAGTYTYTANAPSLTPAVATEVVNPGAAMAFTVTGLGPFTAPGMSGSVTITAKDMYGNTATGFTGAVTLSSSDSEATYSPVSYTYTAADNGVHVFGVMLNTAGTQSVTATSAAITGSETGIVVEDAIWLINSGGTLVRLTDAGVQTGTAGSVNAASTYAGIAFDNVGNVWAVDQGANNVFEFGHLGGSIALSSAAAAGVNTPTALAIDGAGMVWIADGNNRVSVISSATNAAVTPSTGYQGGSISTPTGLVIDSSGSVWLANSGNNSVTKIIGGAAPVVTPIVTGTATNTLGTRPQ